MHGRYRRTKRLLFYAAVRTCQAVVRLLPRRAALALFSEVGAIVHKIDRPAVRRSEAHLRLALPECQDGRFREDLVRAMFRAHGKNLVDLLRLGHVSPAEIQKIVILRGFENLEKAYAQGNGVLAVSAHLGNWEILGAAIATRGIPLHVVTRTLFDERSDALLNRWRRRMGLTPHGRENGLMGVARALRHGHVVGVLLDQDTAGPGVWADFFGQKARTPSTPFLLARRLGASICPMTISMNQATGLHEAVIHPAIPAVPGLKAEELLERDLLAWHGILEEEIRRHPEQWVWFHRRWRSAPRPLPVASAGPAGAVRTSRPLRFSR